MFQKSRYLTRGIQHEIPFDIQIMLWELIDKRIASGAKMDYLQIFDLKAKGSEDYPVQHLVHRQEQPDYKMEYAIEYKNPVTEKIYVIDSGEYSTMLLASEY